MEDIKEFGTTIKGDTEKALEAVSQEFNAANSSTSRSSADPNATSTAFKIDLNAKEEEGFKEFMQRFEMDTKKQEIANLLATNTAVHSLYQSVVPKELSADEFWGRYFWRNEENAKKEQSRLQLLNKTKALASKMSEEEFKWDDDEEESTTLQETVESDKKVDETSTTKSEAQVEPQPESPVDSELTHPEDSKNDANEDTEEKTEEKEQIENEVEQSETNEKIESKNNDENVEAESVPSKEHKPADEDVFDWN